MHAGKKGGDAWLGEVDGDIPEAKLKEFQAEWRKRQPRGQDDGSEQGVGARGRRAAKARGVGEGEGGRGQEAEGGKGREEGVGGGKASAARGVQAAEAAVARAAQAVQSGIGDADAVERRRQLAADQAVAGTRIYLARVEEMHSGKLWNGEAGSKQRLRERVFASRLSKRVQFHVQAVLHKSYLR